MSEVQCERSLSVALVCVLLLLHLQIMRQTDNRAAVSVLNTGLYCSEAAGGQSINAEHKMIQKRYLLISELLKCTVEKVSKDTLRKRRGAVKHKKVKIFII